MVSKHIIPRPHSDIDMFMKSEKDLGKERPVKVDSPQDSELPAENEGYDDAAHVRVDDLAAGSEVCNHCEDPLCPRRKGEPRVKCIHYGK